MNNQFHVYGQNSIRKHNLEKRKLQTLFFPNKWNFHYFFNMMKDCQQFIIACISEIDHSWIIKLLVLLANGGRKIYLIMDCQEDQKNDELFQAMICELLIESQFKIKIVVNTKKYESLPTNFCVIDGKVLITTSANWTINSFKKSHEWMMIDKKYDNIVEMIEIFEQMWNQFKFVTFINEDIALLDNDDSQFQLVFTYSQDCVVDTL
ncbi:unnamed protein product [Paramecium pentaurelia]|uniref:Mitochondrial cardiolipin hydrolase n=1 Tax=Paramecium pentaurelia TaxID=43138 RepID=A0A8S1WWJ7_9CILI|nr:unnamed protein product [Paramecium pentaurelia]